MRTHDGSPTKTTLPMLLGLALVGWTGAMPAFAQNNSPNPNMTPAPSMTTQNEAAYDVMKDDTARSVLGLKPGQDPDTIPDPMPLNYPYAAPGGLQLQHYADYTKFEILPGSVNDVHYYWEKMHRIDLDENGHVRWRNRPLYYRRYDNDTTGAAYYPDQNQNTSTTYYDINVFSRPVGMGAGGDFIYIVRNNTLYQLKAADMSIAAQKDLPMADTTASDTNNQTPPARNWMRPINVAVNGDSVYILRGNMLYQFHVSDLSLVNQKELGSMGVGNNTNGAVVAPNTNTTPAPAPANP
jgi:hypothetical protein